MGRQVFKEQNVVKTNVISDCTFLDVVFIVDSSSSIGADNFELIRSFLRRVIQTLDVGLDTTRVSFCELNRGVWSF